MIEEKIAQSKQTLLEENERQYGAEIREKYGDKAVEEANARFISLSPEQLTEGERLRIAYEQMLIAAAAQGDAAGDLAQQACEMHRQWLVIFAPAYSREYHISLGELYVADERFKAYYDKIAPGCAEFFRDAINVYCQRAAQPEI